MFHSTDLKRLEDNCDVAFLSPNVSRDFFAAGSTAHAIIEEATRRQPEDEEALAALADKVCKILIEEGRSFDDIPEPPLPPNQVMEGREIALNWITYNGIPQGEPEVGLAVTSDMAQCSYLGELAYYGALIDNVEVGADGDEDFEYDVVIATDYKSAWPTNASEMDTLQRKGQAILMWAHYGDRVQCIRQRVINLRTSAVYDRNIFLDDEGIATLKRYWKDVIMLCDKAEKVIKAPQAVIARPGTGCLECHLAAICPDAWEAVIQSPSAESKYIVATAILNELKPVVKALKGDVTIDSGVGLKEKMKRFLTDDAAGRLAEVWDADSQVVIAAVLRAAKIGVTQAENIAKIAYPGRDKAADRKAFIASITEQKTVAEFGVYK